ncbi:hypothetical protein [Brasilonema sennae]|nr:hypothetical protein [Brasilonema sennae]
MTNDKWQIQQNSASPESASPESEVKMALGLTFRQDRCTSITCNAL